VVSGERKKDLNKDGIQKVVKTGQKFIEDGENYVKK